jgi:predicted phage tail protein
MVSVSAKISVITVATSKRKPPKIEPPTRRKAESNTTPAAMRGMSNIRRKHKNMMFEISCFVSGKTPNTSLTFDETKPVETCSPMKTIKKSTTARKAVTLLTIVTSLGGGGVDEGVKPVMGRKTVNPKIAMKKVVRSLLISVLTRALLTSLLMSDLPL